MQDSLRNPLPEIPNVSAITTTSAPPSIRVLVVEDHHLVREGLVALLNGADGIEVVAQAADGTEGVEQHLKYHPDITLIDLRMPRMGGIDVIRRVHANDPTARFIVLTTYDGDEDISRALEAGARGYLLKGMTIQELLISIRTVHSGDSHIPPVIAQRLAERVLTRHLSPRESAVLNGIVHGMSNREIAVQLNVALSTVKSHVNSVLDKMGVSDRTQAVTAAIKRGIVSIESD